MPRFVARSGAAVVLSIAATAAWISPAAVAASVQPVAARPAVAAIKGSLSGVAATSASNAWAVGVAGTNKSLAMHWNGHAWTRVPAPGTGLGNVAASSPRNAWAVGDAGSRPLIVHWNGHSWKRTAAPFPRGSTLHGIATTSAGNAWAVGSYFVGENYRTLTLHWNGHGWKRVTSPSPRPGAHWGDLLASVAIVSARNVWATGSKTSQFAGEQGSIILHWNGRKWSQASAKAVTAGASGLTGAVATSAANVWTAGCRCAGGPGGGVIGHWNGHSWAKQRTPVGRRFGAVLSSVGASSRRAAFAVGTYCKSACNTSNAFYAGLILRWTGSAWKIVANPAGRNTFLTSVAVASASSAWAVGDVSPSNTAVILHWNGRSWRKVA